MAKLYNSGTNKQGLIVYGGEASSDYGMVIAEAPAFDKPTKRVEVFTVPGRNGSILFQDGSYDDVVRSYNVWLADDDGDFVEKVAAFSAWLYSKSGYQRLEDSFEPDVFRLGYYNGSGDVSNEFMQYGEATVSFTCRPERFLKSGDKAVTVSNGSSIYNPTRFESKPLIHIEGSGLVSLSIAGTVIKATITDYINIDCERMNAYRLPAENKNDKITGTFPTIKPGTNSIATTGSVTKVEITPKYFTI